MNGLPIKTGLLFYLVGIRVTGYAAEPRNRRPPGNISRSIEHNSVFWSLTTSHCNGDKHRTAPILQLCRTSQSEPIQVVVLKFSFSPWTDSNFMCFTNDHVRTRTRHEDVGIRKVYLQPQGIRAIFEDDLHNFYIFNPVADQCLQLTNLDGIVESVSTSSVICAESNLQISTDHNWFTSSW